MLEKDNHHGDRNVWSFFLLTFIYSWSLWLPFVLNGLGVIEHSDTLDSLRTPAVLLGAFAPLLAAVTMIAYKNGWTELGKYILKVFDMRAKVRYFILALMLP